MLSTCTSTLTCHMTVPGSIETGDCTERRLHATCLPMLSIGEECVGAVTGGFALTSYMMNSAVLKEKVAYNWRTAGKAFEVDLPVVSKVAGVNA